MLHNVEADSSASKNHHLLNLMSFQTWMTIFLSNNYLIFRCFKTDVIICEVKLFNGSEYVRYTNVI